MSSNHRDGKDFNDQPELKKCSNCFKIKPVSEFYVKRTEGRHQSRCKDCNNEVVAGYRKRRPLKFTNSRDGIERTDITVKFRFTREEIIRLADGKDESREHLKWCIKTFFADAFYKWSDKENE